jgi:N-methylhydantoinase B
VGGLSESLRERDPVTFEVIRRALMAIAAEMKVAMMRTAYSPLIAVGGDLSTAVADAKVEVVAQGQDIPVQLGAIPLSLRMTVSAFGAERLGDGDVLVSNDPYAAGSNHLNDVCMVMPVFVEGSLFAYTVSRAHWTDIGGHSPGAFNTRVWDIYGEGLRIPAVLAYHKYEPVESTHNLILANVRNPEERIWDIRCQYSACVAGQRSLRRLCAKYSAETVATCMEEAKDYSERRLRARIAAIPDGTYRFHDYMESDGWDVRPVRIEAAVTIRGTDVEVDFAGTESQVRGGVNAPLSITEGVCLYAVKAVTDHTIPSNAGMERPLRVVAPKGSVVNPTFPAPCSTGSASDTAQRLADLLMACFAQAVPKAVVAGSYASAGLTMWTGRDPIEWRRKLLGRDRVVVMDNIPGGFGARPDKDGINGIKVHTGNALITPVEVIEYNAPIRVRRWEIVIDTGGAGRFRGGCAAVREFEVLYDDTLVMCQLERTRIPPFGLFGGQAGATGSIVVNRGRTDEQQLGPKNPLLMIKRGDVLTFQPAGAGGYGDPLERPSDEVLTDVVNGYVSAAEARKEYGLVLADSDLTIDVAGTDAERQRLRQRRGPLRAVDRGRRGFDNLD